MLDGLIMFQTSVETNTLNILEGLICSGYAKDQQLIRTLSKTCWHLFKKFSAETDKLPPTEGAFIQHVKRAFYQLSIGEQATSASISHKSPDDYGWRD